METNLYAMMLHRGKTYNNLNGEAVKRHVDNIRRLDDEGHLEYCGVFKGFPGVAGMIILRAGNLEEAQALCLREPLVTEGYATYKLYPFQAASRENNYLL